MSKSFPSIVLFVFIYPIFILLLLPKESDGCSCLPQSPKDAYCFADWVSHVIVNGEQVIRQNGIMEKRYTVRHLQAFKIPTSFGGVLPTYVTTPLQSATCGLDLEVGKEYLLSGNLGGSGNLVAHSCGQIQPTDHSAIVSEWSTVPTSFIKLLISQYFEPCLERKFA